MSASELELAIEKIKKSLSENILLEKVKVGEDEYTFRSLVEMEYSLNILERFKNEKSSTKIKSVVAEAKDSWL